MTARSAPAPAPNHVYENPGTYTITLVVTDNQAATDDVSATQVVVGEPAASTVSYVGGAVNQGNVATPNVTTPTTVSAGDRLVLVLSVNASNRVISDPTGITGWTVLDTTTSGTMQTRVYTKIATATDANKKVTVPLDAAAKYTMTVADYSGVRAGTMVTPTSRRPSSRPATRRRPSTPLRALGWSPTGPTSPPRPPASRCRAR